MDLASPGDVLHAALMANWRPSYLHMPFFQWQVKGVRAQVSHDRVTSAIDSFGPGTLAGGQLNTSEHKKGFHV